jgi:outer membrane protein assembly factor BamB
VAIPGKGSSTPIVWKDLVILTTAIPVEGAPAEAAPQPASGRRSWMRGVEPTVATFVVMAINRRDGGTIWQKTVREERPHEGTHGTGTWASNSPVTDGEHIYAYFGSRGLYCFDMDGNLKWEKDFGDMNKKMSFGEGSSPALHGDRIVILWDHEGSSFVTALDKKTGKELWKKDRDETTSWSSPFVVKNGGVEQVVTSATNRIRSYDLSDGRLIWECDGMTSNAIPTPVTLDGVLYAMSGFRGNALLAIRLQGARGDISDSDAIVWQHDRDTPYTPSPLLYGDALYFLKSNSGILSRFDARTGEPHFTQRLEDVGTVYASPVGAAGRVYVTDREGNTAVLSHGPKFEVLTTNSLDDGFDASAVVVGDQILLRGHKNLYCISEVK